VAHQCSHSPTPRSCIPGLELPGEIPVSRSQPDYPKKKKKKKKIMSVVLEEEQEQEQEQEEAHLA